MIKRGSKALTILLVLVFTLAFVVSSYAATDTDIMSVQLGTRDLTQDQIKYLQNDKKLLEERSKKDVQYLLNQAEDSMNKDCLAKSKALGYTLLAAGSDTTLGTDVAYTSTDTGNKGTESDLVATANARWANSYSDADSYTAAIGSASSWAYNAKTINVKGTGTKNAYIRFSGTYTGITNPGLMGGTAGAKVRVSVYDITAGSEIGDGTILDLSDTITGHSYINKSFSKSVLVSLQAGHSYLLRFGVSTSVANYSPQICNSDFYGSTNHGVKTTKVVVDYQ